MTLNNLKTGIQRQSANIVGVIVLVVILMCPSLSRAAVSSLQPNKTVQASQYRAYAKAIQPWFVLARKARHTLNTFEPTDPNALQHWAAFYQEWEVTSGQAKLYLQRLQALPVTQYRSYQALQVLQQQLTTYRSVLQQGRLGLPGTTPQHQLEAAENTRLALEQWLALEGLYAPLW